MMAILNNYIWNGKCSKENDEQFIYDTAFSPYRALSNGDKEILQINLGIDLSEKINKSWADIEPSPFVKKCIDDIQERIDDYANKAQKCIDSIDINNTSGLLQRIRTLQENNTAWAHECENLGAIFWYKLFLFASCALNLAFIFGIVGWWLWLKSV